MKKIVLIGLMVSLLPVLVGATTTDTPKIDVETGFTDPYPVEPGKNLELSIVISNSGSEEAEDVTVGLEPPEPFSMVENPKKNIKTLYPGDSRVLDYDLFVDSSAVSAKYNIPVRIEYDGVVLIKKIQIRVQGIPKFELLDLESDTISPGDQADISVWIQNVGTGKAKRTTATFSSTSDYVEPIFSGGNVYIGDLEPDEKKHVEFRIMASPDAEYGVYAGNVNISYEDESGNELSTNFDVGIMVSGKPEFQIIETETRREGGEISIEITNIGTAEAKAITGKLIVDEEVFDVDYVTSVGIDKHTRLRFDIPRARKGELELSYEGPDNEGYTQTEIVTWIAPAFRMPSWVWIVVGVIVVYVLWKKKWYKKIL